MGKRMQRIPYRVKTLTRLMVQIIGRIKRRGGTVEIVSRAGWGTEVRMHMPIALKAAQGEHR